MCISPQYAILKTDGSKADFSYKNSQSEHTTPLPCGKCHICISKRSLEWATRCRHEISEHQQSSFVTLTYNEESKISDIIIYSDFQKFMYKIRKEYPKQVRYIVSSEYGTNYQRPHFHCILFGLNPPNQKHVKTTPKGSKLYTSELISDLWKNGYHSIGEANEATAYYIASYALSSSKHQVILKDGEIIDVQDTMKSSKNPAIGLTHFLKHYESITEFAIQKNKPLPRYYLKKLEEINPQLWLRYKLHKEENFSMRNIHSDYAKLLEFKSKNNIYNFNDREIKDYTPLENSLKLQVQNTNAYIKEQKNESKAILNLRR